MTSLRGAPLILVVDDEPGNRALLTRLLVRDGYRVETAEDGEAALVAVAVNTPDLVLLDVRLPGIDGFEVCRRLKGQAATRLLPVVLVTGLDAREHKIDGIRAGADDFLSKPIDPAELTARVASLVRIKRYTDELESAESVILSLALTVEARDPYTEGHCLRLARYGVALGERLGLSGEERAALRRGGYLHDVGKIGVPDSILLKPGPLTAAELIMIQQHTIIGERLCGDLRSLTAVRAIVRQHHERLDGSGYPDHLRGGAISVAAQIIGVVDSYDAMSTTRPYRAAMPASHAFAELVADMNLGRHSADLVRPFIAMGTEGILDEIARGASPGTGHPSRN